MCMQVLCSVQDCQIAAATMHNLLKPGGQLLFWEHCKLTHNGGLHYKFLRREALFAVKVEKALEAGGLIPGIDNATNFDESPSSVQANAATPSDLLHRPATATNMKDQDTRIMSLGPHYLKVYEWESPIPTDFLNLTDTRKQWKASMDQQQGASDPDEELDEWTEVSGRGADYQALFPNMLLRFSIARTFISRAKRAFRAGRTWQEFEVEELAIDPQAKAKATKKPEVRALELRECLNNKLRLSVFDEVKVRLCNEIWLQAYPAPAVEVEIGDKALKQKDSFIDEEAAGRAKGKGKGKAQALAPMGVAPSNPCDREVPEGPQSAPMKATAMNMSRHVVKGENGYPELFVSDDEGEEI
nr:hypothetical protein B0A51_15337 [Rachicladosporium sp. CCFEE 5018]OQO28505.1 hypothetical protein B0A51_03317 [Rachicladosporium sp. CCFEE 5018]OQO29793.1 hypothetical protein B0A51_03232 [Rachicladosporium sp. CCFEE 5018]